MLNDRPVACQIRGSTDSQGDRCPHIPAALAATYPLRCFAPQWARFDNRHSTSAPDPTLAQRQRQRRRDSFAPRRELLLSAVTKVAKSTGRNYVSALPQRAIPGSDLLRILADIAFHHRCRSKGLRVRSPARRLTRPLASATAGVFAPTASPQSLPLEWRTPSSLPPGGFAVLNDTPVACQIRGPTRRETDASEADG